MVTVDKNLLQRQAKLNLVESRSAGANGDHAMVDCRKVFAVPLVEPWY